MGQKPIRPIDLARWAWGITAGKAKPSLGQRESGFVPSPDPTKGQKPNRQGLNWKLNSIFDKLNWLIFSATPRDHILGTIINVDDIDNEATIYYDFATATFKDNINATVNLVAGEKIRVDSIDVMTADLVFPVAVEVDFIIEIDLANHKITFTDLSGKIKARNGTINITGKSDATKINGTSLILSFTGTGTLFNNGVLTTNNTIAGTAVLNEPNLISNSPTQLASQQSIKTYVDQKSSGFKNILINGNMDIWQRGTAISNGGYLCDRWRNNRSSTNATHARVELSLADSKLIGAKYYISQVVTHAANGWASIEQRIEGLHIEFEGKSLTLSFWAKADAVKTINFTAYRNYTDPLVVDPAHYIQPLSLSTTWIKYTITFQLSSFQAHTPGSNDFIGISFDTDSPILNQSGVFDFAQIQLEMGTVATSFEHRPFGLELSLCRRYFEKSYSVNMNPGTPGVLGFFNSTFLIGTDSLGKQAIEFKITKRSAGTLTLYRASTGLLGYDYRHNVSQAWKASGGSYPFSVHIMAERVFLWHYGNINTVYESECHYTLDAEI